MHSKSHLRKEGLSWLMVWSGSIVVGEAAGHTESGSGEMRAGAQTAFSFLFVQSGPSAQVMVSLPSANPVWTHPQTDLEVMGNPITFIKRISHHRGSSDPPPACPFRMLLGGCCFEVSWLVRFNERLSPQPSNRLLTGVGVHRYSWVCPLQNTSSPL